MTGLRFCAHSGSFKDKSELLRFKMGSVQDGIGSRWDGAVFLDLPAPMAIFTSVVNDCVYPEIYRFIGINRVVRYIWRKYI